MRYNEVKISLGQTINYRQYESLRVDFSLSAVINEDDDPDKKIADTHKKCREGLKLITEIEMNRIRGYHDDNDPYSNLIY